MKIMRLSEIIYELEQMPDDKPVYFDFCHFRPTTLSSSRGDYSQLALGYTDEYKTDHITVGRLLKDCKEAVGKTFEGYKGGEFVMHEGTKVWVSNYGSSSSTVITNITHDSYTCIIHTGHMDFAEASDQ